MTHEKNNNDIEILIAEENPTQAEKLQSLLERHDYTTLAAHDGKQALAAIRRCRPMLVVSAVMTPEMDGFTLCREIKRDERLKDIPVVLLTPLSNTLDIVKGLECGADNFIRKPYEDRHLLDRIGRLLQDLELRRQRTRTGTEIHLSGQNRLIAAERQQIVDLLISVYEEAVHIGETLTARQNELAHSNQSLSSLYRVAEGINRAANEHEICEKALEHAMELPGIQAGWIFLRDEAHRAFRTVATRNLPPALLNENMMEGLCNCRRRFLAGDLDHVTNILECERLKNAAGETHGLRYHASVPLWIGGRNLGIMNLVGAEQGLFRDDELKTLYGIGHQMGIALERTRLHQHLERLVEERTATLAAEVEQRRRAEARIERLNHLYAMLSGINNTIVRVREAQELFDNACRIAVDNGQFVFAWIGTLSDGAQEITPVARTGYDDDYLSHVSLAVAADDPDRHRMMAEVITHGKPAICHDFATDERMRTWRAGALARGYRSAVMLPLILHGRPVGIFALYAPETKFFDEEELRLLIEIAGDISFAMDHLEKERRLDYLAYFDVITDLPNRTLFLDRVGQRISAAHHEKKALSVIMLNLERFSSVNESFGRQAGDDLLRQLAQRLRQCLDETDILARLSADDFCISIKCDDDGTHAAHVLERILSGIRNQPFQIGGQELCVSARAGISSYPTDGQNTETLLRNAEAALKKAKLSGDRYLFYAPEFNARIAEKLTLETRLRRALDQDQLTLCYQPQIELTNGRICGLEALLRWHDPETGPVPPVKFIPLLEETGMILEVGRWTLAKVAADCRSWQAHGCRPPRVAVNISPVQLRQKDFVGMVADITNQGGNNAVTLGLEITESVLMRDVETNVRKLKALRKMGITIAIDDFGTGYSSLSYIARLPVNVLKIDRAFITNMTIDPDDLSIVSTIISLAHSLKLQVVAEGVETKEQADLLRLLKCDEIQGYLFSPAVPAEQIEGFLRERKSLPGMQMIPSGILTR